MIRSVFLTISNLDIFLKHLQRKYYPTRVGLRTESMFQTNVLCHRNKMIASPDTSWLMCQRSLCTALPKAGEHADFPIAH